jgi:Leucine-rich repeat (LRR) protein
MFRSQVLQFENQHGRSLDVRRFVNFVLKGGNLALRGGNHEYQTILKLILQDVRYPTGQQLKDFILPQNDHTVKQVKIEEDKESKELCFTLEAPGSGIIQYPNICMDQNQTIGDLVDQIPYPVLIYQSQTSPQPLQVTHPLKDLVSDPSNNTVLVIHKLSLEKLAESMNLQYFDFDGATIRYMNSGNTPKIENIDSLGYFKNTIQLRFYQNDDIWQQQFITLPSSIQQLSKLQNLSMQNILENSIPTQIGKLHNLTTIIITKNRNLTGRIPTEIGNLTKMESMQIAENFQEWGPHNSRMHGISLDQPQQINPIPTQIGNLVNLRRLDLHKNLLTSIIPTEIGNLTQLHELNLSYNYLIGNIPTEISNLRELAMCNLSHNQLNGVIPSQLASLPIQNLDISSNKLQGTIPIEFKNMPHLWELVLDNHNIVLEYVSSELINNQITENQTKFTS